VYYFSTLSLLFALRNVAMRLLVLVAALVAFVAFLGSLYFQPDLFLPTPEESPQVVFAALDIDMSLQDTPPLQLYTPGMGYHFGRWKYAISNLTFHPLNLFQQLVQMKAWHFFAVRVLFICSTFNC
jgi:hypothetical protein